MGDSQFRGDFVRSDHERMTKGDAGLMSDVLKLEAFQPHVGETFQLEFADGQTLDFELQSATPLTDHGSLGSPDSGYRTPFSLLLMGPEGLDLPQSTYHFAHDELGSIDIFLVPIERSGNRLTYQAIFN